MKPLIRKTTVAAFMVAGLAATTFATASSIITPRIITDLESEGGKIHKSFKISDNLNGFAVNLGAEQLILYATADGKHIFQGNLIDNDANDLTKKYEDRYLPKPDFSAVIPMFENSKFFETHDAKGDTTLYVLHDPRCPYCVRSMDMIMEREHMKGVKVRWLPVAALGQESLNLAAAMLAKDSPVKFQTDLNNGYSLTARDRSASEKHKQHIMDNTQLMPLIQATGTPAYLIVNEKTKTVERVIHGFNPNEVSKAWK